MTKRRREEKNPITNYYDFQKRALLLASDYYQGISNLISKTPLDVLAIRDKHDDSNALRLIADSSDIVQSLVIDATRDLMSKSTTSNLNMKKGIKRKISELIQDSQESLEPTIMSIDSNSSIISPSISSISDPVDIIRVNDIIPTEELEQKDYITPPPTTSLENHLRSQFENQDNILRMPLSPIVKKYVDSKSSTTLRKSPSKSLNTRRSWTPQEIDAVARVSTIARTQNAIQRRSSHLWN